MDKKVFCGKCKFVKSVEIEDGKTLEEMLYGTSFKRYIIKEYCSKDFIITNNYERTQKAYKWCDKKNQNNNCPDYEPKFFIRLKEMFKKRVKC